MAESVSSRAICALCFGKRFSSFWNLRPSQNELKLMTTFVLTLSSFLLHLHLNIMRLRCLRLLLRRSLAL